MSSWQSWVAGLVFLIVAIPAAFAVAAASYSNALSTGTDAYWMRGPAGRRRGAALLLRLFSMSKRAGRAAVDQRMQAAAEAKAKLLADAPRGGIVFAGSSTFTYWLNLERDMLAAGLTDKTRCVNAGFGGACSRHVLGAVETIVLPLQPRVVVYFCGTNDLNLGDSVQEAVSNFKAFVTRVRAASPSTRIVFLAASVTPFVLSRGEALVGCFRELNAAVCHYAASPAASGVVEFVDSGAFQSDVDSYLGDMHHLRPEGHAALARLLAPAVTRALAAADRGE